MKRDEHLRWLKYLRAFEHGLGALELNRILPGWDSRIVPNWIGGLIILATNPQSNEPLQQCQLWQESEEDPPAMNFDDFIKAKLEMALISIRDNIYFGES